MSLTQKSLDSANASTKNIKPQSEDNVNNEKRFSQVVDTDTLINQSMTMKEVNCMLEMTFIDNGIYDWYDGKYKNGDEWLRGVGVDEVTEYVKNTESAK